MNDDQLHKLYKFLAEKFGNIDIRFDSVDRRFEALEASVDARFDAVDAKLETFKAGVHGRFQENDLKQNEILNLIGEDNAARDKIIRNHEKRLMKLKGRAA